MAAVWLKLEANEEDEPIELEDCRPRIIVDLKVELESVSDSSDFNHEGNGVLCRSYNHDGCKRGLECKFSHAPNYKSVRDPLSYLPIMTLEGFGDATDDLGHAAYMSRGMVSGSGHGRSDDHGGMRRGGQHGELGLDNFAERVARVNRGYIEYEIRSE
ncbi:hypothetical protein H4582DRAFT_2056832 [Lactarius indigo]|nr:hypothetical protein H4582DRAFT_2061946 [Lactarius indigo]KAI9438974.1 hypothetical protein H4582DRAFT_2056832 [Lactarius indigo]